MAIVSTDIVYRLSGGASNTSPAAALGGAMSTVAGGIITSAALNNLFDDVSGAESSAGDVEYRCLYVQNAHGSLTLQAAIAWIEALTNSAQTEFDIALAGEAVGVAAETIANESTAPSGEVFTRPTSKGAGLSIGDIPAGSYKAIWIRRTVTAGASAVSDSGTIRVEGDSAP